MKSGLVWILALSLCANGVLLAARWLSTESSARAVSPASGDPDAGWSGAAAATRTVRASDAPLAPGAATPGAGLWSTLDLSDLRSVVAALRASGLPEQDVRVIVKAMVDDQFKARLEALEVQRRQRPFWQTSVPGAGSEWANRYSESYAIWREIETIKRDLLGPDPLGPVERRDLREQYGPLTDEKIRALLQLDRDYQDLAMQARSVGGGPAMPWENEQYAFVEAEKRRDIEALLSPEELITDDLHASSLSHEMRYQLTSFEPSEAEFLALYAARSAHAQAHGLVMPARDSGDLAAAEKVKPQLDEQIKAVLGEARYKDYERTMDPGYQAAYAVAKRLNLPPESAASAYALAEETHTAVKALNLDAALSPAERAAAMGRLLDEANAQLDTLLTKSGAAVYKGRSSQWRYVESERAQKEKEAR